MMTRLEQNEAREIASALKYLVDAAEQTLETRRNRALEDMKFSGQTNLGDGLDFFEAQHFRSIDRAKRLIETVET